MKRQCFLIFLALICLVGCFAGLMTACKSGDKTTITDAPGTYTYRNPDATLPDYDTDVIRVDGSLDESIYETLRFWEEPYPEDAGVNVRATAYAGEKGIFFVFDVDDYEIHVNPLRSSWDNSGITVYVAKSGTRNLTEGVWEIEICPDNSINAKRYTGGYYYASIQPDGYENKPFVRTVTKGGAVNTEACSGYVMESYFPYEYLFGSEEKPDGFEVNFSLQRNSSDEKNHGRDTYYNFGEHLLPTYNWNSPLTWWHFDHYGIDSVSVSTAVTGGGRAEVTDRYVVRYGSTSVRLLPAAGYRIASVIRDGTDVTDEIRLSGNVSILKLRTLSENCRLDITFEPIPGENHIVDGRVTYLTAALATEDTTDLLVRLNLGGVLYTAPIAADGTYSLTAPTGKGKLEVMRASEDFRIVDGYYAASATLTPERNTLRLALGLGDDINFGNKEGRALISYLLRSASVTEDGTVLRDETIRFSLLGWGEWGTRTNVTLYLKASGGSYFAVGNDTLNRNLLTSSQLTALGGDGLRVFLMQKESYQYALYTTDGVHLVHLRDIENRQSHHIYGYEMTYTGEGSVYAVTAAYSCGEDLLSEINACESLTLSNITEGKTERVVELENQSLYGNTVTGTDTGTSLADWDWGNSVWHYGAELSYYFRNGKIVRDLNVKFAHSGAGEWGAVFWQYNVYLKLDTATQQASIVLQTSDDWTSVSYILTEAQFARLAETGRLDFYLVHLKENKTDAVTLYIGGADGSVTETGVTVRSKVNFAGCKVTVESFGKGATFRVDCHRFYADPDMDTGKTAAELIAFTCSADTAPDKAQIPDAGSIPVSGEDTDGTSFGGLIRFP